MWAQSKKSNSKLSYWAPGCGQMQKGGSEPGGRGVNLENPGLGFPGGVRTRAASSEAGSWIWAR